ncbi:RraA famliy [Bosea sp. OK403]|uniref:RraA family protein n=1 Tax=Bosea sp. OK403 TaxID=1855286 RepID=UPI0008ECB3DF|nr:RraA family protein [Bosea sp. OK403]SFJ17714.1 RraA famliy [Bosea sp. OK403]
MSNVGFRIFRRINRPDPGLVRALAVIPVANIADEMNRLFCLDAAIRPWNRALMAGCAFTVRARPGCNLLVHKALDMAAPGDVVIVEDGGDLTTALAGENMVLWARKRGLAGLVIDGAMRDVDAIRELDFPVYARGATPRGPHRNGPGEINVPISCGGVVVNPGDIVLGDGDGVLIVPPREAQAILERAKGKLAKELKTRESIADGTWDRSAYADEALVRMGCEIIDAAFDHSS